MTFTASNGVEISELDSNDGYRTFKIGTFHEVPFLPNEWDALREYFTARTPILLQTQEAGSGDWFTITEYTPGTEVQRERANKTAHLLISQGLYARVIEGEPT